MPDRTEPRRRLHESPGLRAALLYGGPTVAIVILTMWPVIVGGETLVLRDVLETHLMLKAPQAEALRDGVLPVLDVHRAGGQPLLGNPNVVPFYPDNLLYALAPTLWALNAHFWIHWLLAPFAMFWLGRAWGLPRGASWAAGVCYATSGFFLSQLNLYNLVAGAALLPALAAAVLRATGDGESAPRRRAAAAAGGLWAAILLSGDPTLAGIGAALAASAVVVRAPRSLLRYRATGPLAVAIALGTLAALPQIVEFLRVLPETYRGYQGFSDWRLTVAAWRPVHAVEWLVPLPFGRFDLRAEGAFWGSSLFDGELPLLLSLYPGLIALALVLASGVPRHRRAWWAWGLIAVGLLLAAGGTTPMGRWLFELPGARLFRYPVKLWAAVAVGAALLAGVGWQRVFGGRPAVAGETPEVRPGRLGGALGILAALLGAALFGVVRHPEILERATFGYGPAAWTPALAAAERGRWIATLVTVLALALVAALALLLARRRPVLAAALLLVVQSAGQVHLLRPLLLTDSVHHYASPSPLALRLPREARVAHADFLGLFGVERVPAGFDNRWLWTVRQDFAAAIPAAGVLQRDLRYELARSPEGLSSYLARVAHGAMAAGATDGERVAALARWGVGYVISEEPLAGVPPGLARGEEVPGVTDPVYLYRIARPAPDVALADLPVRVPHLNAAWELFKGPGFDPERHVVLPPSAAAPGDDAVPALPPVPDRAPGRLRVLRHGDEALEVAVASPVPAFLVVQRAILPVWRATVDGEPVEIEPANLYRIGVPVPAGRHSVRLWVERRPLRLALAGAAAGVLGLALLCAGGLPGRRRAVVPGGGGGAA